MDNLYVYKVIVLAADNTNFSLTAKMLNTDPSTISRIVKKQEDKLGFLIFNRQTRNKLQLTENGSKFVNHAREIIRRDDEFYSNFKLNFSKNMTIRVGLGNYFTSRLFKLYYDEFQKRHSDIKFIVISDNTAELLRMLDHNLIDIAFINESNLSFSSSNYLLIEKIDLSAHFYTTNKDYKEKKNVNANDKIFNKLIVPYSNTLIRSQIEHFFTVNKRKFDPTIITDNIPISYDLILHNSCTGLIFDMVIQTEHLKDILYPINIDNFTFIFPMYFLAHVTNPIIAEYVDFLKELHSQSTIQS